MLAEDCHIRNNTLNMRKFRRFMTIPLFLISFTFVLISNMHSNLGEHQPNEGWETPIFNENNLTLSPIKISQISESTSRSYDSTSGSSSVHKSDIETFESNHVVTKLGKNHDPANRTGRSLATEEISLNDVFISVKTSAKHHASRLKIVLDTWFTLAPNQTFIFTDSADPIVEKVTGSHLIVTSCGGSHRRSDLCCKMGHEYEKFMSSDMKWFCHVDDDNYLNPHALVQLLRNYPCTKDWYLGKPSTKNKMNAYEQDSGRRVSFWFATGGAGFCISRSLAVKMRAIISYSKFTDACNKIYLPDDVTMGYVIECLLKSKLTVVKEFRSHLEPLKAIPESKLSHQITLSYGSFGKTENVVKISGKFSKAEDPTRFYSLHCALFPNEKVCQSHIQCKKTSRYLSILIFKRPVCGLASSSAKKC